MVVQNGSANLITMKAAFLVSPFKNAKLLNKKDAQMLAIITENKFTFKIQIQIPNEYVFAY